VIKAVLFDFGQTLVDSAQGFREAEKQAQGIIFDDLILKSWTEFQSYYRKLRRDYQDRSPLSRIALWEQVYNHDQREVNQELLIKTEAEYWEIIKKHT
jgi:FMN phosphatase YigB (HAD superfamily)